MRQPAHFLTRAAMLSIALALGVALSSAPANAVDQPAWVNTPSLTAIRVKIKAQDWQGAIKDLNAMVNNGTRSADVYNLLAFSLRKSGDLTNASTYYRRALELDPNHRGALEYQGELYMQTGDIAKARENLARLVRLCPSGCEERQDLEEAIARAQPARAR